MKSLRRTAKRILRLVALAVSLLPCAMSFGQSTRQGALDVKFATSSLDSLMYFSAKNDKNHKNLDGFRTQIYSGSSALSKEEATKAQALLQSTYPSERSYIIYTAPFWRVRVGDYRFKTEALSTLDKLKKLFPGCYIVKDSDVLKSAFQK